MPTILSARVLYDESGQIDYPEIRIEDGLVIAIEAGAASDAPTRRFATTVAFSACGGVRVVVDPKSALYVTGSELDYIGSLDGGFKVKNPNAATSCSCGESFSA